MSTAPRPGWYRDPAGTPAYRWWDGSGWTQELGDSPQAPAPPGDGPTERDGVEEEPEREFLEDGGSGTGHSPWRRVVALVVIVALVAGTGIGVAVLLWGSTDRNAPSGAPAAAGTPERGGQLEKRSRQATIDDATMTLPGEPYLVHADPVLVPKIFDALFVAEAVVHDNYADNEDWSAMVCLGSLDQTLFSGDDLEAGAKSALAQLATRLYGQHPRVDQVRVDDQALDGRPGVLATATVHYDIAGLPSRYDDIQAWFVRQDDGTVVAALTSVPDDADASVREQARRALDTLTLD